MSDDIDITPTPTHPTNQYYEIPVVFVVDASQSVAVLNNGVAQYERVDGSEADAAHLVADALSEADFRNGSEVTPWLDAWCMPANQDITGADNRSGTIVYGSDCALLARLCSEFAEKNTLMASGLGAEHPDVQDAVRLADYLSRYKHNG